MQGYKVEINLIVEASQFDDSWRSEGCHVREFVENLLAPYMKVHKAESRFVGEGDEGTDCDEGTDWKLYPWW